MLSTENINMLVKSYLNQVELLLKDYVSADLFVVYTSIIIGIFACKTVYELSQLISPIYFKSYSNLTKGLQIEWSNRAMSTFHAIYIATVSLYFMLWSDLFSNDLQRGPVTLRSSTISISALGVSVGYFLSDLSMIIWRYPSLGGMEYVIHHLLSLVSVAYAMLMGEAQIYVYMVLISEATTSPFYQSEMVSRCSWNEEVEGVYYKWSRNIPSMACCKNFVVHSLVLAFVRVLRSDEADARHRRDHDARRSVCAVCDELVLVQQDIQGDGEDAQEGVKNRVVREASGRFFL